MTSPHATDNPAGPQKSTGGLNLRTVFHAVKRHPLVLAALVLVGASAAAGVYVFLPLPKKAAAVVYHIAEAPPALLDPTREANTLLQAYKPVQVALVTNKRTMAEVLKDPKVTNLSMLPPGISPLELADYVTIDMKGSTEFMRVTVEGDKAEELIELVGAIDRAYRAASYERDNARRLYRRAALEKEHKEARASLEEFHARIDGIAKRLGSKDGLVLATIDKFRQQNLETALAKLGPVKEEYAAAVATLAEVKKYLRDVARWPAVTAVAGVTWLATQPQRDYVPPSAVDEILRQDPTLFKLEDLVEAARKKVAYAKEELDPNKPGGAKFLKAAEEELKAAEEKRDKWKEESRGRIEQAIRNEVGADEKKLLGAAQAAVDRLDREVKQATKRVEDIEKELGERNRYKIDLETLQREIQVKEAVANRLAGELETMRIEANVPPRVTLSEEPFVVSGIEGNRRLKFSLIAAVGLFGVGFAGLVFLEYRGRRVTHVDDASTGLGARLVGTIPPLVPSSPGAASSDAHAILVESIDTARNILMHGTPGAADARVLLVTSAVSGEGKTTLSGHLAISLTRAGFRTLLVDGDIHAPSAHLLFNLPDAPGLSELLRGEVSIGTAVRPSPVAGLSVLPAGKWTLATRQALVGERWRHLAHELKAQFDFVVVDTSPLLLVSDTMLLAREADAVVLSVMMGVSQVSRVADTIHRLGAVGAELAGVVVNNVKSEVYDYGYAYRAKYPAAPSSPAALPGAALAASGAPNGEE